MALHEKELTLFYHFSSYYCQRSLLTMEEKGLAFKKRLMLPQVHENLEPWYLDINIKGEIPALTHGDHSVSDSNQILDYLDKAFPESQRLQPDERTPEGKKVQQWRNQIDDVKIELLTVGSIRYRNELTKNALAPGVILKIAEGSGKNPGAMYGPFMQKYPKYKEVYEKKIAKWRSLRERYNDYDQVVGEIKRLDVIFDEIEKQLQETKSQSGSGEEHWLLGHTFTAADVYLAVLLNRVKYVGLLHHFHGSKPLLTAYYERLHQRETFLKSCVNLPSMFTSTVIPVMISKLKEMAPIIISIGVVATALVYGFFYVQRGS
ncbi:ganglioside-induced differentiation-associated protein 1-like [Ptychodera flava]|uniref:ganglioside-induced differentiation-associated protein 1-like n=1 Tax=Ptychodera flava TaxID=63121 RepID=UPI00396A2D27